MFKTKVVWNESPQNSLMKELINSRIKLLVEQEKTDGVVDVTSVDNVNTLQRTWIDESTAQEWIEFISQFNPTSATIISNSDSN